MTAWWYWTLFALLALVIVITFWFFHWSLTNGAKHLARRIEIVSDRNDRFWEDRYWTYLRELEAAIARTITVQRAIRENPERVLALLSEDVAFGDVIDAVAS